MIIPVSTGEQYFIVPKNASKEKIIQMIHRRRKAASMIAGVGVFVIGISLWLLAQTELKSLYSSFGRNLPTYTQLAPVISLVVGVLTYYLLYRVMYNTTDYISVKTDEGLLKVILVPQPGVSIVVFAILGSAIGVLSLLYVIPIYSLNGLS